MRGLLGRQGESTGDTGVGGDRVAGHVAGGRAIVAHHYLYVVLLAHVLKTTDKATVNSIRCTEVVFCFCF